jgi:hypothetical protein
MLALAGCNAVFGLEPTRGPDSDGDGTVDARDNCPLIANPDQANADGDALGDACDPCIGPQSGVDSDHDGIDDGCDACTTGANSDEDGDGFLDGCDVCPGDADDQSDADGDGIGDVCDADPGAADHRVFFDGFSPPRAGWQSWLRVWQGTPTGAFAPMTGGGGAVGAWNPESVVQGNEWWFETVAVTPPGAFNGEFFGLYMLTRSDGTETVDCILEYDNGTWHAYGDPAYVIPSGLVARFRYHAHGGADDCQINRVTSPTYTDPVVPDAYVPGLATGNGTEFLWVDVVSR